MKKFIAILTLALIIVSAVGQSPRKQTRFAEAAPSAELLQTNHPMQVARSGAPDFGPSAFTPPAAPSTVLFSEGFETSPAGGGFPANWTSIPTPNGNAWTTDDYSTIFLAHSGSKCANIIYHSTVAHDAWLFSPSIALTSGTTYHISFWVQMSGYIGYEQLEVKIGNSATVVGMTTQLYSNTSTDILAWTQISADFTPTASGNFYLGFHAFSPADEYFIAIDDIAVAETSTNDLQIVAEYPYTQVPTSQNIPSAKAKNVGIMAQTNITLSATINGVAAGTSASVASLAPGATSGELSITPAVVVPEGLDTLVYTVTASETDDEPSDNSAVFIFKGTPNTFAVDNVTAFEGLGSNSGTITFGNIFAINSTTTLSQVIVAFGVAEALDYSISLYSMTGDLAVSATPLFTQTATRNTIGFSVVNVPATTLSPGRYFLCVNQLTSSNIAVSYDENPSKLLYFKDGNNLMTQGGFGAVAIRMVMAVTTCSDPTNLAVEPGSSSAVFSWEGNAVGYNMILNDGVQDYSFYTADDTITITGLPVVSPTYTWRVVALCDATHHSDTIDGPSFTTLCPTTAINTFPWMYGFEDASFECWQQTNVVGTRAWTRMEGNGDFPASAHSGTYNAVFKNESSTADITKLSTPKLDISGLANPVVKFWHTQTSWAPDQDTLKVYYKTSSTGTWTLLATYSADIATWTEETILLPNGSADYHIAFEGIAVYGHGIVLDDISVVDFANWIDASAVSIPQPISGANLTNAETVTVTVKNFGSDPITNLAVTLEVNGTMVVRDTISASIPSLTEYDHTFSVAADLSVVQTHTIKAYTSFAADTTTINDTVVKQVINYGNVAIMGTASEITSCDILFLDDGLHEFYIADVGVVQTMTFLPAIAGKRTRVTFTEFRSVPYQVIWIFEIPGDTLFVYNGRTASPENQIAALTGDLSSAMPLIFESENEDEALTFVYHKNSGNIEDGWEANVECFIPLAKDVKMTNLTLPATGHLTSSETIGVTIKNVGIDALTDIPVVCKVNGVALPVATIAGPLAPTATVTQNFTADMSALGNYDVIAYANLSTDLDHSNDTLTATTQCVPPVAITWDFEQGMPNNFTLKVLDNGIANSTSLFPNNEAWAIFEGNSSVQPIGTKCAISQSWFTNVGEIANRWMITPKLDLRNNAMLQWDASSYEAGYPDGYAIKLSTSDNETASFTNTLFTLPAEQAVWTNHIIDLSPYIGQSVYIAFIQNSYDMNMLMMDNIRILGDASINGISDYADIDNSVKLYPNPTNGIINIVASSEIGKVTVYNQIGQPVYSTIISNTSAPINLSNLSGGLYVVRIQTAEGVSTKKLILRK